MKRWFGALSSEPNKYTQFLGNMFRFDENLMCKNYTLKRILMIIKLLQSTILFSRNVLVHLPIYP